TNPPATNELVQASGRTFTRQVDKLPAREVLAEIDEKIDLDHMEEVLMSEGIKKFADPQKALLALIAEKRKALKKGSSLLDQFKHAPQAWVFRVRKFR